MSWNGSAADGGGYMEINDRSKLRMFAQVDMPKKDKKIHMKNSQANRTDKVELSSNIPEHVKKNQDIRTERVNDAKEQILAGKYEKPEVVDKVVTRLIEQFGF